MQEARLAKDSVWIGIISGNLGEQAWKAGDRLKAIALMEQHIDLSTRYDESKDAMRANLNLARWYVVLSEWQLAQKYVTAGAQLLEEKPYYLQYRMDVAKLRSDIARGLGQQTEELKQLRLYLLLKDSLEEFTETIKKNDTVIQQLRQEIEIASQRDPEYIAQISDSLSNMLQSHIMTDERWLKFKHIFDKVYPRYLTQMKDTYPRITDND